MCLRKTETWKNYCRRDYRRKSCYWNKSTCKHLLCQAYSPYIPQGVEILNCWDVYLFSCWFVGWTPTNNYEWQITKAEYWPLTIMSGLQPSNQGMSIDTPPLRDGAEIYRACSPYALYGQTYRVHGIRTQITVFVIPNIVRNLVEKRKKILRSRSEWQINC